MKSRRSAELHIQRKENEVTVPLTGGNAIISELYHVPTIGQIGRIIDDPAADVGARPDHGKTCSQ